MVHYEIHPLANLMPEMTEQEFKNLKTDIEKNGLHEPIVLYEGKILDGRHRYRTCKELGIEAEFEILDEPPENILAYVISLNINRRHLTDTQRAITAARMIPIYEKEARERQKQGKTLLPNGNKGRTSQKVAKLMNAKTRNVNRVRQVIKSNNSKLISKMESGQIPISLASKMVTHLDETEQNNIIDKSKKDIIQAINKKLGKKPKQLKPIVRPIEQTKDNSSADSIIDELKSKVFTDDEIIEYDKDKPSISIDPKILVKLDKKARKLNKPVSTIINKLLKKAMSKYIFKISREQYELLRAEQELINKISDDNITMSIQNILDNAIVEYIEQIQEDRQTIRTTLPFHSDNFETEIKRL